jgi:hypothetical protein
MNREVHVRICEGLGVKFPGATRPVAPQYPYSATLISSDCQIASSVHALLDTVEVRPPSSPHFGRSACNCLCTP